MITSLRRAGATLTFAALALPLLAAPAYAHVTASPDEAESAYFRTSLRISHGCEGSPTTTVRVRIPEGVENVRAEPALGWDVELVTGEGEAAADSGDDGATAPVTEVTWVGGSLPDTQFQEFGLNFRIADDAPDVLYFPTIQECEDGEHAWIEIPASLGEWHDLDEPAPYVINSVGGSDHGAEPAEDGAEPDAAAPEEADTDATAATEDDSGGGVLPVLALIAGLLGLVAGSAALWLNLRGRAGADRG